MLLKLELKRMARERLADAEILFNAGRFDAATYLCGYVMEIVLKLSICKTLKWDSFPESRKEFEGLASLRPMTSTTYFTYQEWRIKLKNHTFWNGQPLKHGIQSCDIVG